LSRPRPSTRFGSRSRVKWSARRMTRVW
jgi:hypothetical protein